MRTLPILAILLAGAFSLVVSIEPNFVRIPVNTSVAFTVSLSQGEGKVYRVQAFGPFLEWNEKEVWVGPSGKELTLDFHPSEPGTYVITVKAGSNSSSATAEVYVEERDEELLRKIEELKEKVKTEEERKQLEEIERLYNESRYEIARIRIQELEQQIAREHQSSHGIFLNVLVLLALFVLAFILIRLLFI